jgi:hypothetical protein
MAHVIKTSCTMDHKQEFIPRICEVDVHWRRSSIPSCRWRPSCVATSTAACRGQRCVTPAFLPPNKSPNKSCAFSKLSSRAHLPPSNPSHRPTPARAPRIPPAPPGPAPRVPSQRRGRPPRRESRARRGPDGRVRINSSPSVTLLS